MAVLSLIVWRETSIRTNPVLPVAFEHRDHTAEKCVYCHHNYADDTGFDSCYSCHKHEPSVAREMQHMFHEFCRSCHVERALAGDASGPFRRCQECHNEHGRMSQNLELAKP